MRLRPLSAVVMAAGAGTRMKSTLPKPLHPLCGRPMLLHVLDALSLIYVDRAVVVVGHGAERVTKTLHEEAPSDLVIDFVEQHVGRGTGDAVSVALTAFPDDDLDDGDIVVLPGDTPLITPETLHQLVEEHRRTDAAATVLTARLPDPTGYGRVLRDKDRRVQRLVEEGDATEAEREIDEVGTSIYCFRRGLLAPALRRLSPENAQGEYYLTDTVGVLSQAGHRVSAVTADDPMETVGVNDRFQLAVAETELRRRINHEWMKVGVTMVDPARTVVDAHVQLSADVVLQPSSMLQGRTVVGAGAVLGPDVRLVDCAVGERARIETTVGYDAEIGPDAVVGPFAFLGPGSHIPEGFTTGPFYTAAAGDDESV
ncbi:MAG TPA: NTP transferase domain-containing protein [Acidimicrobiales bacterium]|nr:NTP transferase domain-containing protein [Acidimicrobiales bacterium]